MEVPTDWPTIGAMSARVAANRFLETVASRDMDALAECIHPDATWRNVPEPAAEGRDEILAMLGAVLRVCSRTRWDVVSEAYEGDTAWLERVDRFWISGRELAVHCNGVFRFEAGTGRLLEVRDYADLHPWRATLRQAVSGT